MRSIDKIIVHCTAGSQKQTEADLKAEFKRKGWKSPGYHFVIFPDGRIVKMLDESHVSNGVKGHNAHSINVAYVGGIDGNGKAVDNRTQAQKDSLMRLLIQLKRTYSDAKIMGHRDLSPDLNGNGIVDPWERVKECPCFDAITEYWSI